jgi:hypothetical protein
MMLTLLDVNQVRLYSDTEHTTGINVEGGLVTDEVFDKKREHLWSWVWGNILRIV